MATDAQLSEAAASAKRTREAEELLSSKRVKHEGGAAEDAVAAQVHGGQQQPGAAAPEIEKPGPSRAHASQVCHTTLFACTACRPPFWAVEPFNSLLLGTTGSRACAASGPLQTIKSATSAVPAKWLLLKLFPAALVQAEQAGTQPPLAAQVAAPVSLPSVPEAAATSIMPVPTLPPLVTLPATQQGSQGAAAEAVTGSALMAASQPAVLDPPAVMLPVVPAFTDAAGEADAEPMEEQAGEPENDVMEADDLAGVRWLRRAACNGQVALLVIWSLTTWHVTWDALGPEEYLNELCWLLAISPS